MYVHTTTYEVFKNRTELSFFPPLSLLSLFVPFGHCRSPDERQLSEQPILSTRLTKHVIETLMTNNLIDDNKRTLRAHRQLMHT